MFFNKRERKKHSALAVLIVGALAALGAATVFKKGKSAFAGVKGKMKSLFKKECEMMSSNSTNE